MAQQAASSSRQKIAVIGAGISGLASAYLLNRKHDVCLYEAGDYLGGHSNTVDVSINGQSHPVDTGFLVLNDKTYPNLIALLAELNVATYSTDMSFGVSMDDGQLEWAGTDLASVFAQRRNLWSPRFWGMLQDILRFNKAAHANLARVGNSGETLGQLLDAGGYGQLFREGY
ncbi:MAG: FAD-dependent oxidoreductase, partial [Burkholderiales bacterium]|nr:FAD-dependent oxidoreductase [Burkholderiales bacterium]